jgi:RHS repeat-associated protein
VTSTAVFGDGLAFNDPDGDGTPFEFNLRFPGQYLDTETGLHYNYFRDYEAQTGRYVEPDPIGVTTGPWLYPYANGNPMYFIDPRGLFAKTLKCKFEAMFNGLGDAKYCAPEMPDMPEMTEVSKCAACRLKCGGTETAEFIIDKVIERLVVRGLLCMIPPGRVAVTSALLYAAWRKGVDQAKDVGEIVYKSYSCSVECESACAAQ